MSLVVDGLEWNFNGKNSSEIIVAVERFLQRIDTARSRNEIVWIGDDFQVREVVAGHDLWSLSGPESPILLPQEIWQELTAWLFASRRYADEPAWPEGMDQTQIQVDEEPVVDNPDVAWAHHNIRAGRAVACLGLSREGRHQTSSALGAVAVHWIATEASQRAFWRNAVVLEGDNVASLERFAPHAFPDLFFREGVWRGLGDFAGGYSAIREEVQRYLAALDD